MQLVEKQNGKKYGLVFSNLNRYSVKTISEEAKRLYKDHFSAKLFREQLAFHKDIDFSEPVEYIAGYEENEDVIKTFIFEKVMEC